MNIFYLHEDPEISAKMHCDKHVVKMIIEYAQMLSTAHRMLDGVMVKKPSKSGKTMVKHYDLFAINNNNIAYLDRPYEKEAFILQEELLNEYTTNT